MANSSEKLYEFSYLASPELDETGVLELKNTIDAAVVKLGGSVREHLETSKRRLAFPVKKLQTAYLVSEHITLPAQEKKAFEKELRFNDKVLRHMFVALSEKRLVHMQEKKLAHLQAMSREKERATAKRIQQAVAPAHTEKPVEEKKADIAEIERKLDEILGREI
jgi:ribosomal protein S6